jgi:antitoxin PrlF
MCTTESHEFGPMFGVQRSNGASGGRLTLTDWRALSFQPLRLTFKRGKDMAMSKAPIAEEEFKATLTSKGQITLPARVRKFWDLKPGDQVSLGRLRREGGDIRPIHRRSLFERLDELKLPSIGRPLTQADIDEAVAEAMIEKDRRSRGT